ncbi:MAG: hypothetical protein ABI910_23755 [Gemmatimonadota bacterium]
MDTTRIDLHKRESQRCTITTDGKRIECRIGTSRDLFTQTLGDLPRARILLEASTESEWVARHLDTLGHEGVVADPGFAPMYASRSKRVTTEQRDARALCEALCMASGEAIHTITTRAALPLSPHVHEELAPRLRAEGN